MRIFDFDVEQYREQYAEQGWIHVPQGVGAEFLAELTAFVQEQFAAHQVKGRGVHGTKEQAVYEFPAESGFPDSLFDVIAAVTGLNRETLTLSERHIKAYDDDAPADPPAHKDRLSSQVSVGLSIDIPADSTLVLYPTDHRDVNPFNVSPDLRASLTRDELPENCLHDANEVVIDDQHGDVVMFQGSSMWHKRRNAASATNLYLKFNDFGSDPLGEDPSTPARRQATQEALANGDLGASVPVLARRLDTIARARTREPGREIVIADVWGEGKVPLSAAEAELLASLNGGRVADLGADDAIRRLAARGVIDLV
jgi:hypothetical protein